MGGRARLYGVETRVLNQAVKRNLERFPADFMFRLSAKELEAWRSHVVMSNPGTRMGLRRAPFAFTEHGALMAPPEPRECWPDSPRRQPHRWRAESPALPRTRSWSIRTCSTISSGSTIRGARIRRSDR